VSFWLPCLVGPSRLNFGGGADGRGIQGNLQGRAGWWVLFQFAIRGPWILSIWGPSGIPCVIGVHLSGHPLISAQVDASYAFLGQVPGLAERLNPFARLFPRMCWVYIIIGAYPGLFLCFILSLSASWSDSTAALSARGKYAPPICPNGPNNMPLSA
jgi:hypothetical protein